jgi:hypothetical protein
MLISRFKKKLEKLEEIFAKVMPLLHLNSILMVFIGSFETFPLRIVGFYFYILGCIYLKICSLFLGYFKGVYDQSRITIDTKMKKYC